MDPSLLKLSGLKDTQPRRIVLQALSQKSKPVSPYDLGRWLTTKKQPLNTVTIYRVLHAFEEAGIVHRHPCNGLFTLCSLPDHKGHHGFLHCHECGSVEEFASEALCTLEHGIAKQSGFRPSGHVSELVGTCATCLSH